MMIFLINNNNKKVNVLDYKVILVISFLRFFMIVKMKIIKYEFYMIIK